MSINQVCISGNLTRDAELKSAKSGMEILTFTVAVNERRKNPQGEWEDYANFINCTLFGKYGAAIASSMTKGTKVCVAGSLRQSIWEQDGQKRSKLEVIASDVELPPKSKQAVTDELSLYDSNIQF